MKTINTLLLAGALATSLSLATQARAAAFLSPRAQENQIKYVTGADTSPNLVSANYLGAGAKAASLQLATVSGNAETNPSLVSGDYQGAAAKSPNRDLRDTQFQIAPVVEKPQKACPGCCPGK
jgi:hypothetical protein